MEWKKEYDTVVKSCLMDYKKIKEGRTYEFKLE